MILMEEHIELIRQDIKTQTRRQNRGKYQIGKSYAVQSGRGKKGVNDIRIVMDDIYFMTLFGYISTEDAIAEGNYTPEEFEELYEKFYPNWRAKGRWTFKFHKIEI